VARVFFSSGLRRLVGGAESVEIEARDVRELLRALDARFPGLSTQIGDATAIAIDGEILPHAEALMERLRPDSEVHFLPQIGGG
jgi:molybdopterin converting factor small subunit